MSAGTQVSKSWIPWYRGYLSFCLYSGIELPWCLAVLSGGGQVLSLDEVGVLLPSCFSHQGRAPHHLSLKPRETSEGDIDATGEEQGRDNNRENEFDEKENAGEVI